MNKVRLTINIDYNTMSYYIRNHYISQEGQVRNFSKYLLAMGESVYDNRRIKTLVQPTLTTKIDDRERFMKVLITRIIMNKVIKRLLKKYHYPQEAVPYALETVFKQCEQWTDNDKRIIR